jgi:transposase
VWAEDEMRLGLKPVVRRVWAPRGQRPKAPFRRRYEWLYLYGFVHLQSGELHWLILPRVDAKVFSLALSHFAREVGAGEERRIVLVLDQAGWHTGREVEVPEGIHLEFLPARSPELQPAQRLWPLANEALANRLFEDLDMSSKKRWSSAAWRSWSRVISSVRTPSTTGGRMPHSKRGVSMRKRY